MDKRDSTRFIGFTALVVMTVLMFSSSSLLVLKGESGAPYQVIVPMALDVLSMGLCIVLFLSLVTDKHADLSTTYFVCMLIIAFTVFFSGALSWYAEGDSQLIILNEITSSVVYLGVISIAFVLWWFLSYVLGLPRDVARRMNIPVIFLYVIGMSLTLVNLFTHHISYVNPDGVYIYADSFMLNYIPPIIIILLCSFVIYRYESGFRKKLALYAFTIVPAVSMIIDGFIEGVEIMNFLLFLTMLILYGNFYVKRSEDLMKKDNELIKQRAEILVSQIQPHFLYNSLTSIMNIKGNSQETRDSIAYFGKFLRGNLDTLKQRAPIPILKELDHVETFMELEKLNLGMGLELQLIIRDRNFLVPALSIQKLVEMCIDNDYSARNPRGTITVTTDETDNAHVITVEDDGTGFDTDAVLREDLADVFGIHAVESRVKEQVDGTLDIESSEGRGTIITIAIPKTGVSVKRAPYFRNNQVMH